MFLWENFAITFGIKPYNRDFDDCFFSPNLQDNISVYKIWCIGSVYEILMLIIHA